MNFEALHVAELASRTGVSIQKLHQYDLNGLLTPSSYSANGYRLYTAADVARLLHVILLEQLGYSRNEIRRCLNHSSVSRSEAIGMHLTRFQSQIDRLRTLCQLLESAAAHFQLAKEVSIGEQTRIINAISGNI